MDFEIGGHFERGWAVMLLEAEVVVVLLGNFWVLGGTKVGQMGAEEIQRLQQKYH